MKNQTEYMGFRICLKFGGKKFGLEDGEGIYLNKNSTSRVINKAETKGIEYKIKGIVNGMPLAEEPLSKECFEKLIIKYSNKGKVWIKQ